MPNQPTSAPAASLPGVVGTWQGVPIMAAPSLGLGEQLIQMIRGILALLRILVILGGVASFVAAGTAFTSYYADGNRGLASLCAGLGAVALGYLMPTISDYEARYHGRR